MNLPDFSQLVHLLATEAGFNYTLVPSITLVVFDWFLTLDLEVLLIWNSPWNGTKLLFLLTRYMPFIDIPVLLYYQFGYAPLQHACEVAYSFSACSFLIGQSVAMLLLTVRTWAAFGRGKRLAYGLFGFFGGVTILDLIFVGFYLRSATIVASPLPQLLQGCITSEAKALYLASLYLALMVYEGSLSLLMIIRGVSVLRTSGNSELAKVVYRDGIWYYIYMFVLSLVNTVVFFRLQGLLVAMFVSIQRAIYSVLACRVVLHIREQGKVESFPSEQVTQSLQFAQTAHRETDHVVTDVSEEVRV